MSKGKLADYATVGVDKLSLDPSNARSHPDVNLDAIKGSLLKFGQQKPIVVTRKNVVIAGNGTLVAAKALGWKEIQVRYTDLSGPEAIAFALADNRTSELAEWDKGILGQQLQSLYEDGFNITEIGFDPSDFLADIKPNESFDESKEDEVPTDAPSRVNRGEVWQLEEHRLMCGDSTSGDDVSRLFNGKEIKLCFTSPPYADQREYNGGKELSTEKLAKFISVSSSFVENYAVNLGLSRKNNEIQQYWDDYIKAAKDSGLLFLSWNVWNRQGSGFTIGQATAMFAIEHEFIFVFGKEKTKLKRTVPNKHAGSSHKGTIRGEDGSLAPAESKTQKFRQLGTVTTLDTQRGGGEGNHPAAFPVSFPTSYIEAFTDKDQNIYEPFCGSGTTLIACEKTGRKCFGMELDPAYCDIIIKRFEDLTGKTAEKIVS